MPIECENCQGTDFQVQDGATFCLICGTESQEHGMETVVDEETLGAFGEHATSLKKKAISDPGSSRRRRKKRLKLDHSRVKFTSVNVFSYILKGWVQDVACADLGVDEKVLSDIVLALWARYLAKLNVAFVKRNPGLSKYPGFRDLQVKETGRKRLIDPKRIGHFVRKMMEDDPVPGAADESQYYGDDDSHESRRKRSKAKRKFLESFTSDTSSIGNSSSYMTMSETCTDDSEPDDTSEYESEEDRPEKEEAAMIAMHFAMSKLKIKRPRSQLEERFSPVDYLKLKTVFALFCTGVLLVEKNTLTLSDLIRFAKNGTISYATSSQHVPTAMKLKRGFDLGRYSAARLATVPLNHFAVRKDITRLGNFLSLQRASFGNQTHTVRTVMKRYLREFSLPKCLEKVFFHSLEHSGLYNLDMEFDQGNKHSRHHTKDNYFRPVVSADVRALAIILLGLKYLYGLDDVSEVYRASNPGAFDICQWIKLSRHRAILACKHSLEMNERLRPMFNFKIELTRPAWYAALKLERQYVTERKNWQDKDKNSRFFSGEKSLARSLGQDLKVKSLQESYDKCKVNTLKCKKSKMPLHAFTLHYVHEAKLEANEEKLQAEDLAVVKELLAMQSQKIGLKDIALEAIDVPCRPAFVMFNTMPPPDGRKSSENVVYMSRKSVQLEEGKIANFKPTYWFSEMTTKNGPSNMWENHSSESINYLMTILPENFAWILKYFAAATDILPTEIYVELAIMEKSLVRSNSKIFGSVIRGTDSKCTSFAPDYKDRISLIE